jgi:hypothetical protein
MKVKSAAWFGRVALKKITLEAISKRGFWFKIAAGPSVPRKAAKAPSLFLFLGVFA